MKLPLAAHTSRPWRIHEIAPDFTVEDVWALATPGGPDDLARLIGQFGTGNFPEGAPVVVRFLWAARWKLGSLFGWDRDDSGLGTRVHSLRERFPADLQAAPVGPEIANFPFTSLYQLHDEWAAEMANNTMHGVLHLGWVPDDIGGGYHAQMAVLVKPNGRSGAFYMAAIKPFRYLFVYPALLRLVARDWQSTVTAGDAGSQ